MVYFLYLVGRYIDCLIGGIPIVLMGTVGDHRNTQSGRVAVLNVWDLAYGAVLDPCKMVILLAR